MGENESLNPAHIMQTASGFWASKTLLAAVEFDLFTKLADGEMSASEIESKLELHPRGTRDFLDTLLALGFLERDGDGDDPVYRNTPETEAFLNANDPRYVGGMLKMLNNRLYGFWGDLEEGLRTGKAQNELKEGGESVFEKLYEDPDRLEEFLEAMAGLSKGNFYALAQKFDFSEYDSLVDVGGALGNLGRIVAQSHSDLSVVSTDLPEVTKLAEERIEEEGLSDRVDAVARNYQEEELPDADVVTASLILHDLSLEDKTMLMDKIYDAVNPGGCFIAIDNIIDDARRQNVQGLLMSLNMLIETGDEGFDYTGEQFESWALEAGFDDVDVRHLNGPTSMAIAYKE